MQDTTGFSRELVPSCIATKLRIGGNAFAGKIPGGKLQSLMNVRLRKRRPASGTTGLSVLLKAMHAENVLGPCASILCAAVLGTGFYAAWPGRNDAWCSGAEPGTEDPLLGR